MKRDKKHDTTTPTGKKLLKLERTEIRQLEDQDLTRANGGRASICGPSCSNALL